MELYGSVLAVGKGNPEWNYSTPHGAAVFDVTVDQILVVDIDIKAQISA